MHISIYGTENPSNNNPGILIESAKQRLNGKFKEETNGIKIIKITTYSLEFNVSNSTVQPLKFENLRWRTNPFELSFTSCNLQ